VPSYGAEPGDEGGYRTNLNRAPVTGPIIPYASHGGRTPPSMGLAAWIHPAPALCEIYPPRSQREALSLPTPASIATLNPLSLIVLSIPTASVSLSRSSTHKWPSRHHRSQGRDTGHRGQACYPCTSPVQFEASRSLRLPTHLNGRLVDGSAYPRGVKPTRRAPPVRKTGAIRRLRRFRRLERREQRRPDRFPGMPPEITPPRSQARPRGQDTSRRPDTPISQRAFSGSRIGKYS